MVELIWRLISEYGAGFALSALGWTVGFSLLGVIASILFYRLASARGWLDCGFSFDRYIKYFFLLIWIGVGAFTFGSAGGLIGVERSLIHLLKEEKVVTKASQGAAEVLAPTVFDVLVEQVGITPGKMEKGQLRIPMKDLKLLETKANEVIGAAQKKLAGREKGKADVTTVGILRQMLVDTSFSIASSMGGRRQALMMKAFLRKLQKKERADGTVGLGDFAQVMSEHFIEPLAERTLSRSFFWSQLGSCAITLALWLCTLLLTWVVRLFTAKTASPAEETNG